MQTQETKTRSLTDRGTNGRTTWSLRGKVRLTLLTALSLTALAGPGQSTAHAQSSYTVTDLGRLPNSDTSYPHNVDATDPSNVRVVGNTARSGSRYHGFYWSSATKTMVDIGVLGVGSNSQAADVNSKGEVVGQSSTLSTGGNDHAIYWNPSRGAGNPLDLTGSAWPASYAYNINENGIIFGAVYSQSTGVLPACWIPSAPGVYGPTTLLPLPSGAGVTSSLVGQGRNLSESGDIAGAIPNASGGGSAAYWKNTGTAAAPVYGLPTVIAEPVAAAQSLASIINNLGHVVGTYSVTGFSPSRPFGWNPGDVAATDLGVFTSSQSTLPYGLNDLDQVAVFAPVTVGTGTEFRAAIWLPQADPAYGLTAGLNLLTTPSGASTLGGTQTRPYGDRSNGRGFTLNNNSQLVGFSTISTGQAHAILWDKVNKMRDLNSTSLTPTKGTFSYLASAAGITDNGYIVGSGQTVPSKGKTYVNAYLLTPKP